MQDPDFGDMVGCLVILVFLAGAAMIAIGEWEIGLSLYLVLVLIAFIFLMMQGK